MILRTTRFLLLIFILILFGYGYWYWTASWKEAGARTASWKKASSQKAGSRTAIFSRFSYQPDFPFISQFDTVDLDRFSKVYNTQEPLTFEFGRPYHTYQTADSTWLYPWKFPQEIKYRCLRVPSQRCHEPPVATVKKAEDKVKGLAITSPKDVIHVTPCYNRWYNKCLVGEPKVPP